MKTNKTNEKKIFKKRIARELRLKGFDIIRTEPNLYKPEFNVYIFKDTEELHKALDEILE